MNQKCIVCGKVHDFKSALVMYSHRGSTKQTPITKLMPVCKDCRQTAPLSVIYQKAPKYLLQEGK